MKNYNVTPYFDDFDPNKNYHRVLFKPGQAVQARELTQSQTILQNQISEFASSIFSQNTPISGGRITTNLSCEHIKLNLFYENSAILVTDFEDKTITDSTGTITARVIAVATETGNSITAGDPPTLIVTYISGKKFSDATTIYIKEGFATIPKATSIGISGGTTSIGKSSVASISEGVFYVLNGNNDVPSATAGVSATQYSIGNFVKVLPQTIIIEKYDNTPTGRVGLNIVESTVTSSDDLSLLDPATTSSNYQAPGADRYKIALELVSISLAPGNDDNFIELTRIEDGTILKQTDNTSYSSINDYFAKRDYESNGDYIVEDFKLIAAANTASPNTYNLTVGKGIAYVRGYRIENTGPLKLITNRARTTDTIPNNSTYVDYGNYFAVSKLESLFDITTMPAIDLHCVPSETVDRTTALKYNSTKIGTAYIRQLDYQNNTNPANTQTQVFNAHVFDVNVSTFTGNTTSATSTTLTINDSAGVFARANTAYVGSKLIITGGTNIADVKTISAYDGVAKKITVSSAFNITPDNTTKFAIDFDISDIDCLYQVSGSVPYTKEASANIDNSGRVNGAGSATLLQSAGNSELLFKNGYKYSASVNNSNYFSTQIFRNVGFSAVTNSFTITSLDPIQFEGPLNTPITGESFRQLFTLVNRANGQILNFEDATVGYATKTSPNTLTFTSSTFSSITYGIDVVTSMSVSNGNNTNLILKDKNLIVGNTTYVGTLTTVTGNTKIDLATGQTFIPNASITASDISLYVSDVKKVTQILNIDSNSPTGALGSYSDITNSFSINNGQTDNFYNHASIKLLPGIPKPKGNLLVIYDYYSHSGGDGYFSVNSYLNSTSPEVYPEIPTYTAKSGIKYELKDVVDFRPSRKNGVSTFEWEYKTLTNSSNVNLKGTLIPRVLSSVVSDYSYYLARKDKLALTKDGKFLIVEGTPALTPQYPTEPDGSIILANLSLDPYTSYVPGEGPAKARSVPTNLSINKVLHKRWAKSDITDLQKQVDNLEYYTTLNLLEQKASAQQVPDANGLNRFKNGILVDDFSSFSVAETSAPNYAANISIRKQQLSALNDVANFQLQNPNTMKSLGTVKNTNTYSTWSLAGGRTNIFTLPYTIKTLIKQQLASNIISVNPFNIATYEGVATLNPPIDNWVNTVKPPSITINDPKMQFDQQNNGINVLNGGDFQSIPGTTTTYSDTQAQQETAYASQTQGLLSSEKSSAVAAGMTADNGYVNNTAIVPFIRPQEIIVRAKGMTVNTPISCWFDGVNVDKYMQMPNTIEVINVTGKFKQDDIIGFYATNIGIFYPVARVVSVYKYPNTSNYRLYVSETTNPPNAVATTRLINATFDINGNYLSSSATGTVVFNNGSLTSLHLSGDVSGVGGGFTTASEPTPQNIFKSPYIDGFSAFANKYCAWGDQNNGSTYNAIFNWSPPATATYTISAWCTGYASVSLGSGIGVTTLSYYGQTVSTTVSLTKGQTYYPQWNAVNQGSLSGIGVVITDASGTVVWNNLTPNGLNFNAVGTEYAMPGGGAYYIGTTKIKLDQAASQRDEFYTGSTIAIRSSYVYEYKYGATYVPPYPYAGGDGDWCHYGWWQALAAQWQQQYNAAMANRNSTIKFLAIDEFEADIIAYDGATRTATLDPKDQKISVSLGTNSQYGTVNSKYTIKGTIGSIADAIHDGNNAPSLATDERGQFVAIFNCPGSVFNSGSKLFRIDNRVVPEEPATATTWAQAVFLAGGLQGTNITNFSPSIDSSAGKITPIAQQSYSVQNISSSHDPVAQSIIVSKDNYPNGVFLSSIKLFFSKFATTPDVPVTVSIANTLNGVPNGAILDYSTVTLDADEVNTSSTPHYLDPKTYTEFTFSAPVYLQPGVLYAILVKSASSDYKLYYGQQNQVAIPSTGKALPTDANPTNPTKIGAAPYAGALFESQNSITWTADQTKQMMFVINNFEFDITQSPTLPFVVPKGLPTRKLGTNDLMHRRDANSINTLVGGGGAQTGPMHAFNISTTDFVPTGSDIRYNYTTTLTSDYSLTDPIPCTPGKYGTPLQENIFLNDGKGERILLNESEASFELLATLSSTDKYVSPIISDDAVSLFRVINHINNMGLEGSNIISIENEGTSYNVNATSILVSAPDIGSDDAVLGFTANTETGGIDDIFIEYPGSGYLTTPTITIIDESEEGSGAVATVHGETSPSGGNGFAKYFTKKVILTPGNDSGDLKVYYSAYKPLGSEVYVYYRILNANDTELLENQDWQLMTSATNVSAYSKDRKDIIEYECAPGVYGDVPADGISYTNQAGTTYSTFIQFGIKVVMASSDKTNVPFLTDIRAIALPSGAA
jgi:hypothetical protein